MRLLKTSQKTHVADGSFPSYGSSTAFFYSPFKLKLTPSVSNSNDEFRTEISSRFTINIFLNDYRKIDQVTHKPDVDFNQSE